MSAAAVATCALRLLALAFALTLLARSSNPGIASSPVAFAVDVTSDAVDASPGDGVCQTAAQTCSLRAAVQESNMLAGPNEINVPAGAYTLSIPDDGASDDAQGDLDIGDELTITGAGSAATAIDGGGIDRVFTLVGGITAHISGVTIRNGNTPFNGGGIQSGGGLTLNDVVVRDNQAATDGGGIAAGGSALLMANSTVSDNVAGRDGGGVFVGSGSSLTISHTLIDGNQARIGGGVLNRANPATLTAVRLHGNTAADGSGGLSNEGTLTLGQSTIDGNTGTNGAGIVNLGTLTLVNSTVSGNVGSGSGGGVSNDGTMELLNVTIAENSATFASALHNAGTASLKNVILDRGPSGSACLGSFTSLGHNLAEDGSCAASLTANGDLSAVSPLLGQLADNGGPTPTHALVEGSPAIDGGDDNGCPATDQRGAPRPEGSACDIGAYESGGEPAPIQRQGDLGCDGSVSAADALILLFHLGELTLPPRGDECPAPGAGDPAFGDVDCDGEVNESDELALLAFLAGTAYGRAPECIPIGQPLN